MRRPRAPPPVGIDGPGNSCYIRAIYQFLISSRVLLEFLEDYLARSRSHSREPTVFDEQWRNIIASTKIQRRPVVRTDVIRALGERKGHFGEAHNVTDIIDNLPSHIRDLFVVGTRRKIRCDACTTERASRRSVFTMLRITPGWSNYEQGCGAFLRTIGAIRERLGDYTCEVCRTKGRTRSIEDVDEYPRILVIEFARTERDVMENAHGLPPDIIIPGTRRMYKLVALLFATSPGGGHFYTARRRLEFGDAYLLDDARVTPIQDGEIRRGPGYPYYAMYELVAAPGKKRD